MMHQETREQGQELVEQIRLMENQLIQVKSSWAESEHEREQLFVHVQSQDEKII